jgi:hypothetical protein
MGKAQQSYCLIDSIGTLVLPADIAMQLFPLLCQGEVVEYEWTKKTYKRKPQDMHSKITLRQFTIAEYASLALDSDPE